MDLINKSYLERMIQEIVNQTLLKRKGGEANRKEIVRLIKKYSQQRYFNRNEAASYLGMGLTTFDTYKKKYHIKSIVIGTLTRYDKKDLDDFVRKNGVKGYL